MEVFLAVMQHSSVTRAAEKLFLSPGAVSLQIQNLAAELHTELFVRSGRRIIPTEHAQRLAEQAREVVRKVREIQQDFSNVPHEDSRPFHFATGATTLIHRLGAPLRLLRKRFPRADIHVTVAPTEVIVAGLLERRFDLGLISLPYPQKDLTIVPLFEEELLLVMSADNHLSKKKEIAVTDIRGQAFVLLDETHCLSDTIVSFCRQRAFQPVTIEHTSQLATVEELVALGHGVSLIPQMARNLDGSRRRIYRSLSDPKPMRQIVLAWNPYRFQSRVVERFKQCVRQAAKDTPANGKLQGRKK